MIVRINRDTKSNLADRPMTVKALLEIFVTWKSPRRYISIGQIVQIQDVWISHES